MAGLLDYLEGIGETGATLGTGLLSGVVGAPYGLFKGITSGRYGSPEAVRIAEEEAKKFVGKLFKRVLVLDSGARASTTTFTQRGQGDVLLAWENEAFLAQIEEGAGKFDIVLPSMSILAEPSIAVVDRNVEKKKSRDVAEAYLKFLYTPEGQDIVAKNFYRPRNAEVVARYADKFPKLDLVTIADFGGWPDTQKKHFGDGGVFDQIYTAGRR